MGADHPPTTSSKIFGRVVTTIELADDARALIVTARRSPVAGAHEPTLGLYVRMRDQAIRFSGSLSVPEARQLIAAFERGIASLESEWQPGPPAAAARDDRPRAPGRPPASWTREQAAGTAGSGAPTSRQDAPAGEGGDHGR